MEASDYVLPGRAEQFRGRIVDIDSHEATPINYWREEYGSVVDEFASVFLKQDHFINNEKEKDDTEITPETVWQAKQEKAPGSWDMSRRLEVMDFTGVKRQLIYPGTMGTLSVGLYTRANQLDFFRVIPGDAKERAAYARKLHAGHNDWAVRVANYSDRLRPVAILIEETVEELIASAKRLLNHGIRAFWIATDRPLAGVSPAHPVLDPLWAMLEEANAIIAGHVGAVEGFLNSLEWRNAPVFEGYRFAEEFNLDPWSLSTVHLGIQNYVSVMVLGGVFERFPKLMLTSSEFTGQWVGPLGANLDMWDKHKPFKSALGKSPLTMSPSDYMRRNVRVASFDFEPVGDYIRRFGMEEVYCYASDFPHFEGGKDPMGRFSASLQGHSDAVLEKFFVTNGQDLLKD